MAKARKTSGSSGNIEKCKNGKKFDPDLERLREIALKTHGNINGIAAEYGANRDTIYEFMKRSPEGKKIIDEAYVYNSNYDLDLAEYVVRYHMTNYKKNGALSMRAAEKVIDKKGELRGWGALTSNASKDDEIDKEDQYLKSEYDSLKKDKMLKLKDTEIQKLKDALNALQRKANTEL